MGGGFSANKSSRHLHYINRPTVHPSEVIERKYDVPKSPQDSVTSRYGSLVSIFRHITTARNLDFGFAQLFEENMRRLLQARFCRLYIADFEQNRVKFFRSDGEANAPIDGGIVGSTLRTGMPTISAERVANRCFDEFVDGDVSMTCFVDKKKCDPFMSIPVVNCDGAVISVFQVFGPMSKSSFSVDEEIMCRLVAEHLAAVIQNFSEKCNSQEELFAANEIIRTKSFIGNFVAAYGTDTNYTKHFEYLLQQVCNVLNSRKGSLFLLDSESKQFFSVVFDVEPTETSSIATTTGPSEAIRFSIEEGVAGHVYSTKQPFRTPNVAEVPFFNHRIDQVTGFKTVSMICVPIFSRGEVIGVLEVLNKSKGKSFTHEDEQLLLEVAQACSLPAQEVIARLHAPLMQTTSNNFFKFGIHNQISFCADVCGLTTKHNSIREFIQGLENLLLCHINVAVCNIYITDNKAKEIITFKKDKGHPRRMKMTQGITGKAAFLQKTVFIPQVEQSDIFMADVDVVEETPVKCCLSVPLMTAGLLVGVLTFSGKDPHVFRQILDADHFLQIMEFVSTVLKHALHFYDILAETVRHRQHPSSPSLKKKDDAILIIARTLLEELDKTNLVKKIMLAGVGLMQADRCSLFLVDDEFNQLYSLVFDVTHNSADEARPVQAIRFSMDRGIAGYVATTGEIVNLHDVYDDERFNKEVDILTGYRTKSMLCLPILARGHKIIGVLQFVNKLNGVFLPRDEDMANTFSALCGISLHNANLYEKAVSSEKKAQVALELMTYHTKPSEAEICEYKSLIMKMDGYYFDEGILSNYDFDSLELTTQEEILVGLQFFQSLNLIERFTMDREKLIRFLLNIRKNYRSVPYHNFQHALIVSQSMFYFLTVLNLKEKFNDLEILALCIAALCHDIDHRGRNNAFEKLSHSAIAELYEGQPVMEMHHWDRTNSILSTPDLNILDGLSQQEQKEVLATIKYAILATDVQSYKETYAKVKELSSVGFDRNSSESRKALMRIIMSTSDIAAIAKAFKVSYRWAERVQEEFFAQGDAMKRLGFEPPPLFDRGKILLPDSQVDFLNFMGIPMFEAVSSVIPQANTLLDTLRQNTNIWQDLKSKLKRS